MTRRNLNPLGNGAGHQIKRISKRLRAAGLLDCGSSAGGISGSAQLSHTTQHAGFLHAGQQVSLTAFRLAACHYWSMTEDEYKTGVGRRLRIAAQAVTAKENISLAEVARKMRISPQRLGNYFRGDHYPNAFHVWLFCQRYGVTAEWIYREAIPGLPGDLADLIVDAETGNGAAAAGSARQGPRKK
jgi:transcriptional regulator with XRE-family HTH domain